MEKARWALALATVLALGGVIGFVIRGDQGPAVGPADQENQAADNSDRLRELEASNEQLRRELADARGRESELKARLRKQGEAPKEAVEASGASQPTKDKQRQLGTLTSIDDANRVALDLLQREDLEGLWLLGAELLGHGEAGYDKIMELMGLLDQHFRDAGRPPLLWDDEELFIGRFLRALGDHNEDVLKFGLYLTDKDRDSLPGPLREFRRELDDEVGAVLLGAYQGDDPQVYDGYVDFLRGEFEAQGFNKDHPNILAQIPTEAATQLLIDQLEATPENRWADIVRALAWQGGNSARTAIASLRNRTENERLLRVIDAALQALE